MPHLSDGGQPRRALTLVAMTGSLSMIFIDITAVGVALPQIQADLGMSLDQKDWVVTIYTLAMACLVALGGRVADAIGRVPAFVGGVVVFAAASAACGLAGSAAALIAARAIQGVGAALMQPASGALVVSAFAPGSRGKAMAVYVGIPLLFMVVGPVVGGAITQASSWRFCFWINLPIAAASLALTALARPADRRTRGTGFDPLALVLLLAGLPAFILGIQQGNAWGWRSPRILALVIAGVVLLGAFIRLEWRKREPLLALSLFRDRGLLANALVLFFMQFALTGLVIHGSTYAQEILGYDPSLAGASLLPLTIPTLFVVHVAGRLYDRVGVRLPSMIGTIAAAVGGAVAGVGAWSERYGIIAVGMALLGTGVGFALSPTNTDSMSRVPPERRAQVSGLIQTMRHMGGTCGLAVIGATILAMRGRLGAGGAAPREALAGSIALGYLVGAAACALAAIVAVLLHRRSASGERLDIPLGAAEPRAGSP